MSSPRKTANYNLPKSSSNLKGVIYRNDASPLNINGNSLIKKGFGVGNRDRSSFARTSTIPFMVLNESMTEVTNDDERTDSIEEFVFDGKEP